MLTRRQYSETVPLTVRAPWLFPGVTVDFRILDRIKLRENCQKEALVVEDRLRTLCGSALQSIQNCKSSSRQDLMYEVYESLLRFSGREVATYFL